MRDFDAEFDQFWTTYPRKCAKGDARKAWRQVSHLLPPLPVVLSAVAAARRSQQWQREAGQFIPYPATWLRAERWEDEHEVAVLSSDEAKPWHTTAAGIERRGGELGIKPADFSTWPAFRMAVMEAHRLAQREGGNTVAMRRRA